MATHHIAAMLLPTWGHTVSYLYLATRMLRNDSTLVISILQHKILVPQMEAELKTCEYDSTRLRIIGVGKAGSPFGPNMVNEVFQQLHEGWNQNIHCLIEGHEGWPKPHALHMDHLAGGFVIDSTKRVLGPDCKILIWFSCALASMPAVLNEYDFATIAQEIHSDEARRRGRSMNEILDQIALAWNGSDELSGLVMKCPGVPAMYDHERVAYAAGVPQAVAQLFVSAQKLAKVADGYIVPTALCFEPIAVPHCRALYQKRGQELFTVGMQTHDLCWTNRLPLPPTNPVINSFLESSVARYGAQSVLYISFGSLFFPVATPELVQALVSTLLNLEKPFPFIFALGGRLASLPREIIQRVNSSGRGLICDFWVEQRAILQHSGTGWFLTHGGYNSISESLSQGLPLIVWPTAAEQPINAALLSSGPNPVAIELLQVRVGPQLAPSLRGGPPITGTVADASQEFRATFASARGPLGAMLKKNAARMAEDLRAARTRELSDVIIRLAKF